MTTVSRKQSQNDKFNVKDLQWCTDLLNWPIKHLDDKMIHQLKRNLKEMKDLNDQRETKTECIVGFPLQVSLVTCTGFMSVPSIKTLYYHKCIAKCAGLATAPLGAVRGSVPCQAVTC